MVKLSFTKKWSSLVLLEVLGGSCNSGDDYGSSDDNYGVIVLTIVMVVIIGLIFSSSNLCSIILCIVGGYTVS
jgi:hypothetical protein